MRFSVKVACTFLAFGITSILHSQTVYDVGRGVSAPIVFKKVDLEYSDDARQMRSLGTLTLRLVVGMDGKTHDIGVSKSELYLGGRPTPGEIWVTKAKAAVSQWLFIPGMKDGEPVAVFQTIEMHFGPTTIVSRVTSPTPASLQSPNVYRMGGGVSAPQVLYKVDPDYAEEARKARYSGTVVLTLIVDPEGRPRNIRVSRSLGMGLDEKAIEAVSQWKFKPGMKDGQPVNVIATIELNFRLRDEPER